MITSRQTNPPAEKRQKALKKRENLLAKAQKEKARVVTEKGLLSKDFVKYCVKMIYIQ